MMNIRSSLILCFVFLALAGGCRCEAAEPAASKRKLFKVVAGDKVGFMDLTGKLVIPPVYDAADDFREGLAAVGVGSRFFYIDEQGAEAIALPGSFKPWALQSAPNGFSEGLAVFQGENRLKGYFDRSGKVVIPPAFTTASDFSEGLAVVSFEGRGRKLVYGYVDKQGRPAIEAKFDFASDFKDGRATVVLDQPGGSDRWHGLIDKDGNYVVEPALGFIGDIAEGLVPVERGGQVGFVNADGHWVIAPRFEFAREFSEGLAVVEVGGRWGFIDKRGTYVVEPRFDRAEPFSEGLAAVSIGGLWGYINKAGKVVIEPQFDSAHSFSHGRAVVRREKLHSLPGESWSESMQRQALAVIDRKGTVKLSFEGDSLRNRYQDGLLLIQRRGIFAYVDTEGTVIWNGAAATRN